jgi:hypothetical protein
MCHKNKNLEVLSCLLRTKMGHQTHHGWHQSCPWFLLVSKAFLVEGRDVLTTLPDYRGGG